MNQHARSSAVRSSQGAVVLACFVAASVATACSSSPTPPAKDLVVATSPSAAPAATTATSRGVADSPTASAVHIDDAILKACGINAPKAFFAFDSANLAGQDTGLLDQVAQCFSTGPLKGSGMKLIGHADPRGETEYNFVLGNTRADAVASYLRGKGVDKAKLDTTSRGELDATGTDESGWAKDRRVDVKLAK